MLISRLLLSATSLTCAAFTVPNSNHLRHDENELSDRDISIDDAENGIDLYTPSPKKDKHRQRLDTENSVDSDGGGEISGSLSRIEQFINEHTPKSEDKKEIV